MATTGRTATLERRLDVRQTVELTIFATLPAVVALLFAAVLLSGRGLFDFHLFRNAGSAVLDGHSPWESFGFRYPAFAALSFVPFAALPFPLAAVIFCALDVLAIVAILKVLGVRDYRCYTIAFATSPVLVGIAEGTISPWIALSAALAWRYRDRPWIAGGALGISVALKIMLWPLLIWLVVTRRFRAAAVGAATVVGLSLASWLVVGLNTFSQFADVLDPDFGRGTYSLFALGRAIGLGPTAASAAIATISGAMLLGSATSARRESGDWPAFVFGLAAALAASTFMHVHYLSLLLVPIAFARPRISPLWAAPIAFFLFAHQPGGGGSITRIAMVLGLTTFVLVAATRGVAGRRASAEPSSLSPQLGA